MRIYLIFLFAFISAACIAQTNSDEQLAAQFFQDKEYDKALVYYEKLFNKNPLTVYYRNYLVCLTETKDFSKAEKLVKKQVKQNPQNPSYKIDLGMVYRQSGHEEKTKETFEKAIKEMQPASEYVIALANAFMSIKEYDYAITVYKKAQRIMADVYPFNMELADAYSAKGDVVAMINEYLDMLENSEGYIQSVQNALQLSFSKQEDNKKNELVKGELLKRIQKSSDKAIFSELLVWMLIQQKDFEGAFAQAKALDKRKNEEGNRIMSLAQLALSNGNYDLTIKAYQYVIEKGSRNYNYVNAKMESLNAMYQKVVTQNNYTQEDLLSLERNFISTLTELGKSAGTAPLIKNLAHLQAFYLHKNEEAKQLLTEAITLPQLNTTTQADCKLELGNVLLMMGHIWDASLIYSQVEKAFKYETIGQEAKFRNAQLSYYIGDFKWAQAQLDVLKGATAKLIANDAMDLALLISDNLSADSNTTPLLMFSRSELLSFQNKDDDALKTLDSITKLFPTHPLADDILMKKGNIFFKKGKFEESAGFYDKIVTSFSYDVLADDAMFKLADLYENRLNNKEKAMQLYQDLMIKFPGSLYVVEARKRYRGLRGDTVN